jgi:RNA polymerase sigma factor (sigma-70 family)
MVDRYRRRTVNVVGELPADIPSPLLSPGVSLEREELGRQLERAMDSLSSSQRLALESTTFLGLSAREVAAQIGCTPNAARILIQKAKAKMTRVASHCGKFCAVDNGHPDKCPARIKNIDCLKSI